MYTLLNNTPVISRVDYANLSLDYGRKELVRDAQAWITYRRNNPDAVPSDHLLVRILQTLNLSFDGNLDIYKGRVEQRAQQFTGVMGLSSGYYKGRLHTPGVFYGKGYHEAILAIDEEWDLNSPWEEWEPVRVLSHPRSDLGIETLDGESNADETGYAVIAVNIPMLACQYQLWLRSDQSGTEEFRRNSQQFVMMYPLTNALRSHLDIAVFNRLCRRWYNQPVGKSYRRLPIQVSDLTQKFDAVLRQVQDRIAKQAYGFDDILKVVPGAYRDWSLSAHRLPEMFISTQCLWALYLARLNVIGFLVNLCRMTNNQRNIAEFNRIKRSLIEAKSGKWLVNGHPTHLVEYYNQTITDTILPYL